MNERNMEKKCGRVRNACVKGHSKSLLLFLFTNTTNHCTIIIILLLLLLLLLSLLLFFVYGTLLTKKESFPALASLLYPAVPSRLRPCPPPSPPLPKPPFLTTKALCLPLSSPPPLLHSAFLLHLLLVTVFLLTQPATFSRK